MLPSFLFAGYLFLSLIASLLLRASRAVSLSTTILPRSPNIRTPPHLHFFFALPHIILSF